MVFKVVTVLNKELDVGVALNAAAHMALGLAARASGEGQADALSFQDYRDADGLQYPFISGLSLIVLRAKATEIRKFANECREQKILVTSFVQDMTGETFAEQLVRLAARPSDQVIYYGACAMAERSILDPLTKRFSLWK